MGRTAVPGRPTREQVTTKSSVHYRIVRPAYAIIRPKRLIWLGFSRTLELKAQAYPLPVGTPRFSARSDVRHAPANRRTTPAAVRGHACRQPAGATRGRAGRLG